MMIQLTGLSGAGKTTLALAAQAALKKKGIAVEVIDGDVYRKTVCAGLGFSKADRQENIRRLGAVAHAFVQQGKIAVIAAINPYEETRQELVMKYGAQTIWIFCPMETLLERDTKGLYKRSLLPDAHADKISNLTGVNDPYETPSHPELVIDTSQLDIETATELFCRFIFRNLPAQKSVLPPVVHNI